MSKEKFQDRKLTGKIKVACKYDDGTIRYWDTDKEVVISHIVQIVREYQRDGYVLTLRQLHYQLVTKNWIVNHDTAYKKLGSILDDCRYAGIIDWDAIEDRGRVPYLPYWVNNAQEAIDDTIDHFRIDRQEKQKNAVELWTEKDALSGILRRTTTRYHVRLVVNKGYTSSSAIYNAYERIVKSILNGKVATILYFGDHDPSGLDMVRDIRERLTFMLSNGDQLINDPDFFAKMEVWWIDGGFQIWDVVKAGFCPEEVMGLLSEPSFDQAEKWDKQFQAGRMAMYISERGLFNVIPIGLTMDQIEEYNLPPNPTKLTDSRAAGYVRKFGKTCWEVDALKPQILTDIVDHHIQEQINLETFRAALYRESEELEKLKLFNPGK